MSKFIGMRQRSSRKFTELPIFYERLLPITAITRVLFINTIIISIIGILTFFDFASFISVITRGTIARETVIRYFSLKPQEILLHLIILFIFSSIHVFWILRPKRLPLGETYALSIFILLVPLMDILLLLMQANQLSKYSLEHDLLGWFILTIITGMTFFSIGIERYIRKNTLKTLFEFDTTMIVENMNLMSFVSFIVISLGMLLFHPFYNLPNRIVILDIIIQLLVALVSLDLFVIIESWITTLLTYWKTVGLFVLLIIATYCYFKGLKHHVVASIFDPKIRKKHISLQQFTINQRYKLIGLVILVAAFTADDMYSLILWSVIPVLMLSLVNKNDFHRIYLSILSSVVSSLLAARWILTTNLDTSFLNLSTFSITLFIIIVLTFLSLSLLQLGYLISLALFLLSLLITYFFWDNYIYVFIATLLTMLSIFWLQQLQNIVMPTQELCNSSKKARHILEREDVFWDDIQTRFVLKDDIVNRIQAYLYSTLENDRDKILEIIYEPEKPYNAVIFTEKLFYKAITRTLLILSPIFIIPLILIYIPIPFLGLYQSPSVGNFGILVIISLYLLSVIIIWLPPIPIPKFREMELEYRRFKQ